MYRLINKKEVGILKKGHVYKIFHRDAQCSKYPRQYILCCPIEDIIYSLPLKESLCFDNYFLITLANNIKIKGQGVDRYSLYTSFDSLSELHELTNSDLEEVNRACIKGGFKYNRKLGKLIC